MTTLLEPPKAIKTRVFGCRFRSRLEARWAVFLTELGLDWQYEKQGFELPAGRYLPDFWVESWNSWVEIKPTTPSIAELLLCASLHGETGQRVLLFAGECWVAKHAVYQFHESNGAMFNLLGECPTCQGIASMLTLEDGVVKASKFSECQCREALRFPNSDTSLMAAYEAARAARFEHGESA